MFARCESLKIWKKNAAQMFLFPLPILPTNEYTTIFMAKKSLLLQNNQFKGVPKNNKGIEKLLKVYQIQVVFFSEGEIHSPPTHLPAQN